MFEQWQVSVCIPGGAGYEWKRYQPDEGSVLALGGLEACKLLIPRYAHDWAIFRREEGGSWECMESVGDAEEELYMLIMEDMESLGEDWDSLEDIDD